MPKTNNTELNKIEILDIIEDVLSELKINIPTKMDEWLIMKTLMPKIHDIATTYIKKQNKTNKNTTKKASFIRSLSMSQHCIHCHPESNNDLRMS